MLVAIDGVGDAVLATRQGGAIGTRQVSVVRAAHGVLFVIDGSLATFQVVSLMGSELAAGHPLADAILLVFFAVIDGR